MPEERPDPVISNAIARIGAGDAAAELVRLQTTFVEVDFADGAGRERIRIHFRGKRDSLLGRGPIRSLSVEREHPVLLDFLEPHRGVALHSSPADPTGFIEALREATAATFGGWRSLERYLNPYDTAGLLGARAGRLRPAISRATIRDAGNRWNTRVLKRPSGSGRRRVLELPSRRSVQGTTGAGGRSGSDPALTPRGVST